MKKGLILAVILFLLLLGGLWFFVFQGKKVKSDDPGPVVQVESKHSDVLNRSTERMMHAYYKMLEGFVNWDTTVINDTGIELLVALDSLTIDELQNDSLVYEKAQEPVSQAKGEVESIIHDPSIAEKRGSLNTLSDLLKTFLMTIRYDGARIYWQECPMAFNDVNPGYWLSRTEAIRNPYLGTSHPKYKDGMLECGGTKDSIDFITPMKSTQ